MEERGPATLPEFDTEERNYIAVMATQLPANSSLQQALSYAAFFAPSVTIGVYGLYSQDLKITGVGFLTLVASLIWTLVTTGKTSRYDTLAAKVFVKINEKIEEERRGRR